MASEQFCEIWPSDSDGRSGPLAVRHYRHAVSYMKADTFTIGETECDVVVDVCSALGIQHHTQDIER